VVATQSRPISLLAGMVQQRIFLQTMKQRCIVSSLEEEVVYIILE
jgi:hypothetical protein